MLHMLHVTIDSIDLVAKLLHITMENAIPVHVI